MKVSRALRAVSVTELLVGSALGAVVVVGVLVFFASFNRGDQFSKIRQNLLTESFRISDLIKEDLSNAIRLFNENQDWVGISGEPEDVNTGKGSVAADRLSIQREVLSSQTLTGSIFKNASGQYVLSWRMEKVNEGGNVVNLNCDNPSDGILIQCIFRDAVEVITDATASEAFRADFLVVSSRETTLATDIPIIGWTVQDLGDRIEIRDFFAPFIVDEPEFDPDSLVGDVVQLNFLTEVNWVPDLNAGSLSLVRPTGGSTKVTNRLREFKVEYRAVNFENRIASDFFQANYAGADSWHRDLTAHPSGCPGSDPSCAKWREVGQVRIEFSICESDLPRGLSEIQIQAANSPPFYTSTKGELCVRQTLNVRPKNFFASSEDEFLGNFVAGTCNEYSRCVDGCEQVFNSDDRSSDWWKGYRAGSDYCLCGTCGGSFVPNYFNPSTGDYNVCDHNYSTSSGREALEACFATWGCAYGHQHSTINSRIRDDSSYSSLGSAHFNSLDYLPGYDHPGAYLACSQQCFNPETDSNGNVVRPVMCDNVPIREGATGFGLGRLMESQISEAHSLCGPTEGVLLPDDLDGENSSVGHPAVSCAAGANRINLGGTHDGFSMCGAAARDFVEGGNPFSGRKLWRETCSCRVGHHDFQGNQIGNIYWHLIRWHHVASAASLPSDADGYFGGSGTTIGDDQAGDYAETFQLVQSSGNDVACSNTMELMSSSQSIDSPFGPTVSEYYRYLRSDVDPSADNHHPYGLLQNHEIVARCLRKAVDRSGGLDGGAETVDSHGAMAFNGYSSSNAYSRWQMTQNTNFRDYSVDALGVEHTFVRLPQEWNLNSSTWNQSTTGRWIPWRGLSVSNEDSTTEEPLGYCHITGAFSHNSQGINSCVAFPFYINGQADRNYSETLTYVMSLNLVRITDLPTPLTNDIFRPGESEYNTTLALMREAWIRLALSYHFGTAGGGGSGAPQPYANQPSVAINADGDTTTIFTSPADFIRAWFPVGESVPASFTLLNSVVISVGGTGTGELEDAWKLRTYCAPGCTTPGEEIQLDSGDPADPGNPGDFTGWSNTQASIAIRRFALGTPFDTTNNRPYPNPGWCQWPGQTAPPVDGGNFDGADVF